LTLPDLGLSGETVAASIWLVEVGAEVSQGDRLLEVVAAGVTVDLPCPASGILQQTLVSEDDVLQTGQALALIAAKERE